MREQRKVSEEEEKGEIEGGGKVSEEEKGGIEGGENTHEEGGAKAMSQGLAREERKASGFRRQTTR